MAPSGMKTIALLAATAAIMGGDFIQVGGERYDPRFSGKAPAPPILAGCKEYFFNKHGVFSTEKMMREYCVFKCVASNDKNAKKKFASWQTQNSKP